MASQPPSSGRPSTPGRDTKPRGGEEAPGETGRLCLPGLAGHRRRPESPRTCSVCGPAGAVLLRLVMASAQARRHAGGRPPGGSGDLSGADVPSTLLMAFSRLQETPYCRGPSPLLRRLPVGVNHAYNTPARQLLDEHCVTHPGTVPGPADT